MGKIEKALVMLIAAVQTNAAMAAWGPTSASHPASADISDPNLRTVNLQDWEEFRIFYNATITALNDDANWKAPDFGLSPAGIIGTLTNLMPLVAGLIGSPPWIAIIQALIKSINVPPTPSNPGN